jgi:septal ring factor EnvC (AmiA/AmiB activator)
MPNLPQEAEPTNSQRGLRGLWRSVHAQFWIGTFIGSLLVPIVEAGTGLLVANRNETVKQQVQYLVIYINKFSENPPKTVHDAEQVCAFFELQLQLTKQYARPDGFDASYAYAKKILSDLKAREREEQLAKEQALAKEAELEARKAKEREEQRKREAVAAAEIAAAEAARAEAQKREAEAAAKVATAERARAEAQVRAAEAASERSIARDFARKSWRYL